MIGAIQTPQYGLIISQVTIRIHTADLFGGLMLRQRRGCSFRKQKTTTSFKQMSSIKKRKKEKGETPSAQSQPMALLDCRPLHRPHLLIATSASSWHVWLYVEDKNQMTRGCSPKRYLLNYRLLCSTQHRIKTRMLLRFPMMYRYPPRCGGAEGLK